MTGQALSTTKPTARPAEPWRQRLIRSLLYGRNVDRAAKARARVGFAVLAFALVYAILAGRLVMINPAGANPETQVRLVPLGGDRFRYEAASGGGPVGEVVRFVEEHGRVVRMFTGDSYTERVNP